ncbi:MULTISPECIES: HlyD family secretion protein [Calditerrivibrio]|uniref:HlyD family secretion protein n=1 Tax=Calditerrivibrio TaxID=545865 RepID=UPI003C725CAA
MGKKIKIAIVLLGVGFIIFLVIATWWIKIRMEYASTDAFFIKSDTISNVGFKRVSGKVIKLNFKEGDRVKKGDILAVIDDSDYRIKAEQLKYEIQSLEQQAQSLDDKRSKTSSDILTSTKMQTDKVAALKYELASSQKSIEEIEILIAQSQKDMERYKVLYEKNAIPKKSYEDIANNLDTLKKKKESLQLKIDALGKQIDIAENEKNLIKNNRYIISEISKNKSSIAEKINSLKKQLDDLNNMIEDCKLYAPFDGVVGMKYVDVGTVVSSGNFIYSIVGDKNLYGYVLLEEGKLKGVDVGDKATFIVDAYPKERFEGEVEAIYPASAATYALVPRDISAGEFTKVAQRIPIRIKITGGKLELLRVGMGGEIKIKR